MKSKAITTLATRLLAWHDVHGRHALPWARERTPYRVWLSEIMLQQTQVATVIPYFERFVGRFPGVRELAAADIDAVLHLWTGLGYYSRARNLHATAQRVVAVHAGELPRDLTSLMALPGIGRSTAAAILAQAWDLPHAILDGNVKRVLARYHAIAGYPGERAVEAELWRLSEQHLPATRLRDYTQALMDLGATLCTRSRPRCAECPLHIDCRARQQGRQQALPTRRPQRDTPTRQALYLLIEDSAGAVLLEQRPAQGLWAGLWSFPELLGEATTPADIAAALAARGLADAEIRGEFASFTHAFTHFKLAIRTLYLSVPRRALVLADSDRRLWFAPDAPAQIGLSAPVVKLLADWQRGARDADLLPLPARRR